MTVLAGGDFYTGLSAWSTFGGAVGTVLAVVTTAVVAIRTLNASKRDSQDRSRPMVGALLERDPHPTARTSYLVVRNYGPSVAYDVQLTFDPPIEDLPTRSNQRSLVPFLLARYENPIDNIMPGVEFRNVWYLGVAGADGNTVVNDMPIPDVVTVRIRYSNRPNFWAKDAERYVDTFTLDTRTLRAETFSSFSDDHLGLRKRSTKALERVAPAMERIAKDVGRIEEYVKPDEVREREQQELEESLRIHAELTGKLLPNRPDAENERATRP